LNSPAAFFAFWTDRWLGGTAGMTTHEKGVYISCLVHQFVHGSLPQDKRRLALICGCSETEFCEAWDACVAEKFELRDGCYANPKMAEERERAIQKAERARANGRKGGRPARKPSGEPTAKPSGIPSGHPSTEPSGKATQTQTQTQRESSTSGRTSTRKRVNLETLTANPLVLDAARAWRDYRAESGLKPWALTTWKQRMADANADPQGFADAVKHSISQGYHGLFPPKGGQGKPDKLPKALQTLKDWHDDSDY
jgi:uncharacterized protein YdaU (DUF1376 family)